MDSKKPGPVYQSTHAVRAELFAEQCSALQVEPTDEQAVVQIKHGCNGRFVEAPKGRLTVKSFLEVIKESLFLESLQLDLSIEAARSNRCNERMVIDARALHSLHQVNIQLWSHGTEPLYLQLILLLGDFFKQLVVADDNSLQSQLVDGQPLCPQLNCLGP